MRAVVLRSLVVIGIGAVLLAGVLYVASTVDARAPEVIGVRLTQPAPDQQAVAQITTSIEVEFNEPVEPDSAAQALRIEPPVPGSVSWSGSTMIFTPAEPLRPETDYVLSLDAGVRDLSGNEMAQLPDPFAFATVGRPTVSASEPADGDRDVALDATIVLTFSSLMDTASVEAALRLQPAFPHELRWSGDQLEIVPTQPLEAGREYRVRIREGAADVSGATLARGVSIGFRTIEPGLRAATVVPSDGIAGIAPTSPIALIFDKPIDPGSVERALLTITPDVAGSLEVVAVPGEERDDGAGRILRFTPSGPLPSTTTFEVTLAAAITGVDGEGLGREISWSFTTGAPVGTLSNQIAFLSDRAGVTNVWVMNPDGTGQRQLSAELTPVTDYAVAPDGSTLAVTDGRRIVVLRPDGSDRRVLTPDGAIDVDPAYSPNGSELVFARLAAPSDRPTGLWRWEIGAGDPAPIELPVEDGPTTSPTPSPTPSPTTSGGADVTPTGTLRAPRFAPDGRAIAFVDVSGSVGILELEDETLSVAAVAAAAPPVWLPDSSGVLLSPGRVERTETAPVPPLDGAAEGPLEVLRRGRSGTTPADVGGVRVLALAADGRLAVAGADRRLRVADAPDEPARATSLGAEAVAGVAWAPSEASVLAVTLEAGNLVLFDLEDGSTRQLAQSGASPRWLP